MNTVLLMVASLIFIGIVAKSWLRCFCSSGGICLAQKVTEMDMALIASCCLVLVIAGFLAILIYSLCVVAGSEPPRQF